MSAYTSANVELYACENLPATRDQSGYEALSWSYVGEVTSIGDYGAEYSVVNHNALGSRVTIKKKGTINYGSMEISCARDHNDPGQDVVAAAADSDCDISFKVALGERLCSGGETEGTVEYFEGTVTSKKTTGLGGPDNILGLTFSVEINTPILEIKPA